MTNKKVLVSTYSHPELYPPTLNAVGSLSKKFDKILLHFNNVAESDWNYPLNVSLFPSRKFIHWRKLMVSPLFKKINFFREFTVQLYQIIKKENPKYLLLYDPMALLAFSILRRFLSPIPMIWYHNHDIITKSQTSLFSLTRLAYYNERKSFKWIQVFSLPSEQRKLYFKLDDFKGAYFLLPNYPALDFYNQFYQKKTKPIAEFKIIYQGFIDVGHGIEEIIEILGDKQFENIPVKLVLKGYIKDHYKKKLVDLMLVNNISALKIEFVGVGPYKSVPEIASTCHIGIGINTKVDPTNATLGTSSNKIYEYAALGLPVLLYDAPQFRNNLDKYDWAIFTDISRNSLKNGIIEIISNYDYLSESAHHTFLNELNFDLSFDKVINFIKNE